MITEDMMLNLIMIMSVTLIMLVFGMVFMINFGDDAIDLVRTIKNKADKKKRKKEVKKNQKIDIFEVEHDFWMDGVRLEQKEINNTILTIEEEIDVLNNNNQRWVEEMNKKIGDVKVIVDDYEKMKKTDKLVVETDVKRMLEKITKELRTELKTIKEERQEKIKEIYQRKIEKLEAK